LRFNVRHFFRHEGGVANIERSDERTDAVWGVLHLCDNAHLALLDAAELRLRSAQCQLVRLETAVDNVAALLFYKRRGYNVLETIPRYYSNGMDALLLEKDLLLPVVSTGVLR